MANPANRLFFIGIVAVGLGMTIWGWRAFTKAEPVRSMSDEEAPRICAPTIGEVIEDSPIPRELGCLVITSVGMGAVGFSLLSLAKHGHE
jgi:hypothetical protein